MKQVLSCWIACSQRVSEPRERAKPRSLSRLMATTTPSRFSASFFHLTRRAAIDAVPPTTTAVALLPPPRLLSFFSVFSFLSVDALFLFFSRCGLARRQIQQQDLAFCASAHDVILSPHLIHLRVGNLISTQQSSLSQKQPSREIWPLSSPANLLLYPPALTWYA